jgi:hypothetical protein
MHRRHSVMERETLEVGVKRKGLVVTLAGVFQCVRSRLLDRRVWEKHLPDIVVSYMELMETQKQSTARAGLSFVSSGIRKSSAVLEWAILRTNCQRCRGRIEANVRCGRFSELFPAMKTVKRIPSEMAATTGPTVAGLVPQRDHKWP